MPIVISPTTLAAFKSLRRPADLAALFRTTYKRLNYHLYRSAVVYQTFQLPKKSGGLRSIQSPPRTIKAFQDVLLACLSAMYLPIRDVQGFAAGRSVVHNAKRHVHKRLVLNFDLEDFFPSINFGRIQGVFEHAPFNFPGRIASMLAHICCWGQKLPTGAPTSPILSNLVCRGLDRQLKAAARSHGCTYSRYADDITLSTNERSFPVEIVKNAYKNPAELGDVIASIVAQNGFKINERKTRVSTRSQRQEVTGIVVNERVNVPREYVHDLRAMLHCWQAKGDAEAERIFLAKHYSRHRLGSPPSFREHARGKLDFLSMVRGKDDPVYCRLAIRHAHLAQEKPVQLSGSGCIVPGFLEEALWILVGLDAQGHEICSATGFALHGVGIVSAAHTFELDGLAKCRAIPAFAPAKHYPVSRVVASFHHDIAAFEPPAFTPAVFVRGNSAAINTDEQVTLAGYPEPHRVGDPVRVERGHVTRIKTVSLVRHFLTTAEVIPGNSGGPLFDGLGKVIGIARYSNQNPALPNACVAIEHIEELNGSGKVLQF